MPIMEPARPFKALTAAEPPDVTNAFNPFLMPLTVAPLILFPILFQKESFLVIPFSISLLTVLINPSWLTAIEVFELLNVLARLKLKLEILVVFITIVPVISPLVWAIPVVFILLTAQPLISKLAKLCVLRLGS